MKKDTIKINFHNQKNEKIDYPIFFNYIKVIKYELVESKKTLKLNTVENIKSERFYKSIIKI